ncbi:MAG: hypothetical protein AAGB93_09115 [Planctomycetota bacterium]
MGESPYDHGPTLPWHGSVRRWIPGTAVSDAPAGDRRVLDEV